MLKVEPIKKYIYPSYPDKRVVLENPDILKNMPQRWKGKAFAGLAVSSMILLLLSGCEKQQPPTGGTPLPPNYLTEEEAYNIINDEASKYGVVFDTKSLELTDIELQLDQQSSQGATPFAHKLNIQLDGYDNDKRIGFEFISNNDVDEFNNSIQNLNVEGVESLWIDKYSDKLEKAIKLKDEKMYFDAFYNNASGTDEQLEAELREQVKSFMEWLKAQGVI